MATRSHQNPIARNQGAAAVLVQRLEFAVKHGGAIADNLSDGGAEAVIEQLW